jgi:hypothetical protein
VVISTSVANWYKVNFCCKCFLGGSGGGSIPELEQRVQEMKLRFDSIVAEQVAHQ